MKYQIPKERVEQTLEIRAVIDRKIQNGETLSAEMLNQELRKWESRPKTRSLFPPYYRAQICYRFLLRIEIGGNPVEDFSVPREILTAWGKAIARDGLAVNIAIPDDAAMKKELSRPLRFVSSDWEKQGHTHQADGLSLLERIYSVYRLLGNDSK